MDPVEVYEERRVEGSPMTTTGWTGPPGQEDRYRRTIYPVAWRSIQAIWLAAGVMNAILGLDFLFRLFRANDVGFSDLIYSLAGPLAAPFDGIFRQTITRSSLIVRWADLLGIAIYSLIAYGVCKLVRIASAQRTASPNPPVSASRRVPPM